MISIAESAPLRFHTQSLDLLLPHAATARAGSDVRNTDLLIHPLVPIAGYLPGPQAVERMIAAGADATCLALRRFTAQAA